MLEVHANHIVQNTIAKPPSRSTILLVHGKFSKNSNHDGICLVETSMWCLPISSNRFLRI